MNTTPQSHGNTPAKLSFEELPDILTPADLQRHLPVSRGTVYELLKTRRIQSTRIGRKILIPKNALRNFLNGRETEAPTS
jgi:excisionase family DNA binding protein